MFSKKGKTMSCYRSRHIKKMVSMKLEPHKPGEVVIDINEEIMSWLSDNSSIIRVIRFGADDNSASSASKVEAIIDKIKRG